jgi:uncharacterized membrane protein
MATEAEGAGTGTLAGVRVLLAGETWQSWGVHQKGFNAYYTGGYGEGHEPLTAALRAAGATVTHVPNHLAARTFPRSVAALGDWDVVILSDIGSDTLLLHPDTFERGEVTGDPLAALDAWVRGGGGLLMVGGYLSFTGFLGEARYGMTALAETLPVTMQPQDDRVERPDGVRPVADAGADPDGLLAGIDGEWPAFLGYNRVVAKPGTAVPLRAGMDPFLVAARVGDGRSAAFASDCSPHWGPAGFTGWRHYDRFWTRLVGWLASAERLDRDAGE